MPRVPLRPARRWLLVCGLLLAGCMLAGCVLAGSVIAGCTAAPHTQSGAVAVSSGACGAGWSARHGGDTTIEIHNTGTVTVEVDLIDPETGGVYAEVESLAAGTTRPMHVRLGRGAYALRCLPDGSDALTGSTVRINDGPAGAPAVLPVTEQDLTGAVRQYRAYVTAGLGTLATDVARLRQVLRSGDLRSGDLAASRAAWLTAHLAYERLGAAYDTFGDSGDAIDGLPDGLPGGVHDADFTGLRRIEYGLWHGEPLASVARVADRLGADVARLRADFPSEQTDPNDLPLRAHEIVENAVQFELTGQADQGSGTGLATVDANLTGTRAVLDALAPVLRKRYPGWDSAIDLLTRTQKIVVAQRLPDGRWTAPGALATATRENLDGAVGQLLEALAPIAAIGDVRRTS